MCWRTGLRGPQNVPDVTTMSLEDLMNLQVTSVSKRTQKVADAAAAIFVITQDDIRRIGATSIPDALRIVPGLEVAQIDENKWAIGSRGFNGRFDNKLLVLIDGRSVYTPLFSGVYWNVQDVMLEDVDRIEVIRGPGATLWGANAVDGVINIITKSAKNTQGGLLTCRSGVAGSDRRRRAIWRPRSKTTLIIAFTANTSIGIRRLTPQAQWLPTAGINYAADSASIQT